MSFPGQEGSARPIPRHLREYVRGNPPLPDHRQIPPTKNCSRRYEAEDLKGDPGTDAPGHQQLRLTTSGACRVRRPRRGLVSAHTVLDQQTGQDLRVASQDRRPRPRMGRVSRIVDHSPSRSVTKSVIKWLADGDGKQLSRHSRVQQDAG